jgi:hypothetical protein
MPRPQFSLRTLLAALGLLSVCFGLTSWQGPFGLLLSLVLVSLLVACVGFAKKKKRLVTMGLCMAVVPAAMLVFDLGVQTLWVGHTTVRVSVVVMDAASDAPISGARIQVVMEEISQPLGASHFTDARGKATFSNVAPSFGRDSGLGITRKAYLRSLGLCIVAPGYESRTVSLVDARGQIALPIAHMQLTPITVRLVPLKAADATTRASPQASPPQTPTSASTAQEPQSHPQRPD